MPKSIASEARLLLMTMILVDGGLCCLLPRLSFVRHDDNKEMRFLAAVARRRGVWAMSGVFFWQETTAAAACYLVYGARAACLADCARQNASATRAADALDKPW